MQGRTIIDGNIAGIQNIIALETLSSGMYVLQLTENSYKQQAKFVKE